MVLVVWDILQTRGPPIGLHLNPSKCDPCPIRIEGAGEEGQIKLVPFAMLGVPLGSDGFVDEYVGKKLIGRLQTTISQLVNFEDSQAAFYLLRISFSIVRAVHFMRTTPLPQWREQGLKFDAMLRKAAEDIFGFPMSDSTYAQAALTPKLGGLGLRKTVEHADLAYAASWHEANKQSGEEWKQPPTIPDYIPQKRASFSFDEKVLDFSLTTLARSRGPAASARGATPRWRFHHCRSL